MDPPDGRRVATGGGSNDTVKIWDVANGQEVLTLVTDGMLIKSLSFSPDGNSIAASSRTGVQHVWHAPPPEQIEKHRLSQKTCVDQASLGLATISNEAREVLKKLAQSYSAKLDDLPDDTAVARPRSQLIQSIIQTNSLLFEELRELRPDDVLLDACLARDRALDWTSMSLETAPNWHPELHDLVKTLVHCELGNTEEANPYWRRVQQWREEVEPRIEKNMQVTDWLEAQLLIREIEEKFKSFPKTVGTAF